jgi:hypothetical protein
MVALILPLIVTATIIGLTLGISFLCVEMVLRLMSRVLNPQPAPVPIIRRPINRPAAQSDLTTTTRRGYRLSDNMKVAA